MVKEKILWSEKPSKKFILYYSFLHDPSKLEGPIALTFFIVLWMVGIFHELIVDRTKDDGGWSILIFFGIILALSAIPILVYNIFLRRSYQYTISNKGVKISGGVFKKIDLDLPFSKITNVDISQNIFERMLGIYELHIPTEGSGLFSNEKPRISFLAIKDPNTPKRIILKQLQQANNKYSE